MVRSHLPLVTWPKKNITTLLAGMQTFVLPDVLEDLRSPANLRYQRDLTSFDTEDACFATKHGRYLRKMDKRGIGTLSFVLASSVPVMVVIAQAQGSRFELRHL